MDMFDFAGMLFGRAGTSQQHSVTASGAASSADGVASITLDADVTPADDVDEDADQTIIDLPTSPDVAEGDELIVTLVGDGPLKTPVVTANPGSGDRMRELANSAKTIANAAQAVAEAVNQHFWHDDSGAHVTEATQEEWEQSHSGPNSLWNSLGMLFRDGLNNLLALVTGQETGVAIYDGNGNDAENVVASFTGTEVSLGANSSSSTIDMCGGVFTFGVDNSDNTSPVASINVDANASSGVTTLPKLELLAGSGSDECGIDIVGIGSDQYPVHVISAGWPVAKFGGLGIATHGLSLYGIGSDDGASVDAYNGIYMGTKTGTNFWSTVPGTVLWSSGGYYMTSNHTATLAYNVSTCPTGIVLHFQPYTSSTVQNYFHQYCFVPKTTVTASAGAVHNFTLCNSGFAKVGIKALRVYDNRIVGDDSNDDTGTASGITFDNKYWVMTQVIAV